METLQLLSRPVDGEHRQRCVCPDFAISPIKNKLRGLSAVTLCR